MGPLKNSEGAGGTPRVYKNVKEERGLQSFPRKKTVRVL